MMLLMLKLGIRCYLWQFYENVLPVAAWGVCGGEVCYSSVVLLLIILELSFN